VTRVQRYLFELLAPRRYRRMVNRELEDAAREDKYVRGLLAERAQIIAAMVAMKHKITA